MNSIDYIEKLETKKCTLYLRRDSIIIQRYPETEGYTIEPEDLNELMRSMKVLSKNKKVGILSLVGNYGTHSAEARDVDITRMESYTNALAIVIINLPQRILTILYFKFKSMKYPVKIFKLEAEGIEWLQQQG